VPNVPRFPEVAEREIVRIFNQVIAHLPAEECSTLGIETDLIGLDTCAQVCLEINASRGASKNVAVLDGAYGVLFIESAEVDGQLIKEFHDFRRFVASPSGGHAIPGNDGDGMITRVGKLIAATVRARGGSRECSDFASAVEEIVKRECSDLFVIAEACYKARRICAFHQLDGSFAQLDILGIEAGAAE
jgi:hypothetical protein